MKNEVLLRCKRTRWHSVIGDSSIQKGSAGRPSFPTHTTPSFPRRQESTGQGNTTLSTCLLATMPHVIADLIRNPEGRGWVAIIPHTHNTVIPAKAGI